MDVIFRPADSSGDIGESEDDDDIGEYEDDERGQDSDAHDDDTASTQGMFMLQRRPTYAC